MIKSLTTKTMRIKAENMILEGFVFGMLLQFVIGPVCLYILNSAINRGFMPAFISVAGVTMADAVYILLALLGISGLPKTERTQLSFKIIGGIVIMLFGINIILSSFGLSFMPKISWQGRLNNDISWFSSAFLLTISNPLTIVFWSGVFAIRISEDKQAKSTIFMFGLGAVLSTLVFLSAVAGLGAAFHIYLPDPAVKILNMAAGAAIIILGLLFFGRRISVSK
jgi:threonine/homoserine/homoserine lactone efflux protein